MIITSTFQGWYQLAPCLYNENLSKKIKKNHNHPLIIRLLVKKQNECRKTLRRKIKQNKLSKQARIWTKKNLLTDKSFRSSSLLLLFHQHHFFHRKSLEEGLLTLMIITTITNNIIININIAIIIIFTSDDDDHWNNEARKKLNEKKKKKNIHFIHKCLCVCKYVLQFKFIQKHLVFMKWWTSLMQRIIIGGCEFFYRQHSSVMIHRIWTNIIIIQNINPGRWWWRITRNYIENKKTNILDDNAGKKNHYYHIPKENVIKVYLV